MTATLVTVTAALLGVQQLLGHASVEATRP